MIDVNVPVTIVFSKNHDAINAVDENGQRLYRYIINEGSSRSSKTRSLIQLVHKYGNQHKGKRMSVWRDTLKDCKDTVGADIKEVFPQLPLANYVTFNKTESIYTFPSGSAFEIRGADEPNKLHGYNCHLAWLNEPYQITKDVFDQLDMRTEDVIIIDWNPQESHWIDDLKKDKRAIVIHSTFRDNPFCPPEQRLKILSYQPVKMCKIVEDKLMNEIQAKDYDIVKNPLHIPEKQLIELVRCIENERKGSASSYKWSVYGLGLHAEKPNRIFFWEEIQNTVYDKIDAKKYYGVDWGTVDPWGILEAKYYDGALYLHELNYSSENSIKENLTVNDLMEINKDPEGGIVKWMFTKLNIDRKAYVVCDTNRPLKIEALWNMGYGYAHAAPKPAGSLIDGIDILSNMKIYYTASSHNIKFEQENYSRQIDRYGVVLNEPEDKHNHLIDPTRYVALFLKLLGIMK